MSSELAGRNSRSSSKNSLEVKTKTQLQGPVSLKGYIFFGNLVFWNLSVYSPLFRILCKVGHIKRCEETTVEFR